MTEKGAEGGLEHLLTGGVYRAYFQELSRKRAADGRNDPLVGIISHDGQAGYYGFLGYATLYGNFSKISNEIREHLVRKAYTAKPITVIVIRQPYSGDVYGPYVVRGTYEPPRLPAEFYRVNEEEALSVLRSGNVLYGRCQSIGQRGSPFIEAYGNGEIKKGFIVQPPVSESHTSIDERVRLLCERQLSHTAIKGILPGDDVLVEQTSYDSERGICQFKLLFNFLPEHNATAGDGGSLIANVKGYSEGGIILNLPIVGLVKDDETGKIEGRGYIPNQDYTNASDYFRPVIVRGAGKSGLIVKEAKIISTKRRNLVAEAVR